MKSCSIFSIHLLSRPTASLSFRSFLLFFFGLNFKQLTALHDVILSCPKSFMLATCRVEKNNGKMLLCAIHNTRVSHGHSVRLSAFFYIFDLISFILFHFNHIFAELIFHCCAWSSCGEISVLQYVYVCVFITVHAMLDALGVYGAPRRQVGLTGSLLPHSLIPITWLYMTLRYLCYRCFCLCALSPTHLFPFHSVCSFSFQILESEL